MSNEEFFATVTQIIPVSEPNAWVGRNRQWPNRQSWGYPIEAWALTPTGVYGLTYGHTSLEAVHLKPDFEDLEYHPGGIVDDSPATHPQRGAAERAALMP